MAKKAAFWTTPGSAYWDPWADLNQDLTIDIDDVGIVNAHYGLEIWTYAISGGVVGKLPVIDLVAGSTQMLTFTWDTSGVPYGNYVVCSYAVPILGKETDRADNTLQGGTILVTIPGDANGDHVVNSLDIGTINAHWSPAGGPPPWSLGYDPNVDCNDDGYINILDIGMVNAHWGQSW